MSVPSRRIAIICPTVLERDAVGSATVLMFKDLAAQAGTHVTLLARNSDRTDVEVQTVRSLGDLLLAPAFLEANLIIYVFAIYSDLFDAILIGNGRAAQVARFHNVTPKAFVNERDRAVIDRSMQQIQNFAALDEIWADSQENREELLRQGIDGGKVRVMPLVVTPLTLARLAGKPATVIRFVYVGRFVKSKGLEDLIEAFALLHARRPFPFEARLLGSTRHSLPTYIERLFTMIRESGLEGVIEIEGNVTDAVLTEAYASAHILATASRHEGFCVPVIEALAAGCVPVTYANSNLKHIAGGVGRLARSDTPKALADAMETVGKALHASPPKPIDLDAGRYSPAEFDQKAARHVATFSHDVCAELVRQRASALIETSARP